MGETACGHCASSPVLLRGLILPPRCGCRKHALYPAALPGRGWRCAAGSAVWHRDYRPAGGRPAAERRGGAATG
jgi:hypothetical protein